jgi:hypothetical protein
LWEDKNFVTEFYLLSLGWKINGIDSFNVARNK